MLWHVESISQWVDTLKVGGMMSLLKMEAVSNLGRVVHTRCLAEDYRNRDWCCPVASKTLHIPQSLVMLPLSNRQCQGHCVFGFPSVCAYVH